MTTYLFDKYSEMDDEDVEENDSDDSPFDDNEPRLVFVELLALFVVLL